ncbi:LuxR C-terminal-related transcriptional regulator [Planotetraspora sp. A-T 1434]|uniref:LuxR C-terminal-related transcriptional regulator n=1 Tax=Planotetraspora sp. A-T 1434 TaxID=2979219 RepID=UPI0021C14A74|nr:LuxR C-terminal-related transcriptional regulator [Planotetraspora sp. A-T 1434]MCT9935335.1 LuxR C-terminal-related transcriptional regulator [Planotetraspora sp. A-T 1434]
MRELHRVLEHSQADVVLSTPDSMADVELTANRPNEPDGRDGRDGRDRADGPEGADGAVPRTLLLIDEHEVSVGFDVAASPADGYLIRQKLKADALERALVQLASGEMPLPADLGRMLIGRGRGRGTALALGSARLTFREQEALAHLAHGLSNRQIATRMRISEHGAKRLVSSLLLKLGATNRTAAVVTAIKYGLVEGTAPSN